MQRSEQHSTPMLVVAVVMAAVWVALGGARANAQGQEAPRAETVAVFIDCQGWGGCDSTFFRTELSFVNHVRDRKEADVHVLITSRDTGSGGTENTLKFIGLRRFEGRTFQLLAVTAPTDTFDISRRIVLRALTLGLGPFLAETPLAERLRLGVDQKAAGGAPGAAPGGTAPGKPDSWDYWVFRTGLSFRQSGERAQTSSSASGNFSANRVTEAWKINTSAYGSRSRSSYELSDGSTYVNVSRSFDISGLVVKSLSPHWSAGARIGAAGSTYSNQDLAVRLAPALEYNVFPYAESTRRQLTVQYGLGYSHVDYEEETIYGKFRESLGDQSVSVYLDLTQPWGSSNSSLNLSHYLHDTTKNSLSVSHYMQLRLFKGFSLSASVYASRLHNQLSLPKLGATDEEILVRRRQLETSYRYSFSIGFSYTFGSIYNNIVNTRFGSSGGMYYYY